LLVFFVEKKDEKKGMVQDYRYLNKRTIKNNYPLPLILDLIDTMGTKISLPDFRRPINTGNIVAFMNNIVV